MGTLTVIFIVLKLLEIITWSWFWVLSPIILQVSFVILMWIAGIIATFIAFK